MSNNTVGIIEKFVERRSADYKPNIWNYNLLQFLRYKFHEEGYRKQMEKMIEEVKSLFVETDEPLAKLELLDNIKKLGLSDYFDKEINIVIASFQSPKYENKNVRMEEDLYAASLYFRILRLHGCNVSQEMFKGFVDNIVEKNMNLNAKAIVGLFEASHLAMEGEDILEDARVLASKVLKNVNGESYALELPLNMKVEWFNVINHIQAYEKDSTSNIKLLKLAKLNFNMLQAVHQSELDDILRWWKKLGVMNDLRFARNRVVECYLWTMGVAFEPKYGHLRKCLTKVIKLVVIIDDLYVVFGTLDELEILTNVIERWEFSEGIERLPQPMNYCLKILYDTVDEISQEILKEKGYMVQSHIQDAWKEFCKCLLAEARWYHNGYTPTLEEYLKNRWVTSCGPLLSLHIVFCDSYGPQEEALCLLKKNHDLVYNASMIIRLCNDQGTSKAELGRGNTPTSIMCYMMEENVGEEVAIKYIKNIITEAWKKLNNLSTLQTASIKHITNIARVAHFIYLNGDGFGVQDRDTKDQVLALLVHPLALD